MNNQDNSAKSGAGQGGYPQIASQSVALVRSLTTLSDEDEALILMGDAERIEHLERLFRSKMKGMSVFYDRMDATPAREARACMWAMKSCAIAKRGNIDRAERVLLRATGEARA